MNAIERGGEMMMIPMNQLPELALKYTRELSSKVGMCGEVMLTAFCCYAQCVEGLECTDNLYIASLDAKAWFEANKE